MTRYVPFPSIVGAAFAAVLSMTMGGVAAHAISDSAVGAGALLFLGGVVVPGILLGWTYVRARVEHCSFCSASRREAKQLVSAPVRGVAICERCAPRALAVVLETVGWMGVAGAFPARTPRAVSSPVVEALVARASSDDELRAASACAQRTSNWAAAESALSKIAEAARTPTDWMRLGVFVGKQRRYEDALALTRQAKFLDAEGASIVANNLAWYWAKVAGGSYRSGGRLSRDDAAQWLTALDEAASTLEKDKSEDWAMWFMYCVGTRAEILRLMGDLDGALASFERAAAKYPLSPERLMCRAQVHAARGANAEAAGDLEAALRQLHPESEDAEEARALFEELLAVG